MRRDSFKMIKKMTTAIFLLAVLLFGCMLPKQVNAGIDFTGKLFLEPSTEYNNDLAYMAAELCDKAQSKSRQNTKNALNDGYGIENEPYNYDKSAAFVIGHKKVKIKGEGDATVLLVIARGTETLAEQIGDAGKGVKRDFLDEKVYDNVYDFEEKIWQELYKYLNDNPDIKSDKNLKILVTGYSLGGAAANMVAAKMDYLRERGKWISNVDKEDIYCYTFGAIKVLAQKEKVGYKNIEDGFENIFNIYNKFDTFGPNGDNKWKFFKASHPKTKFGYTLEYDTLHDKEKNSLIPMKDTCNNHDIRNNYKKAVQMGLVEKVARDMGLIQTADSNIQVGDTVYFGKYEQDGNTKNGKERIEWQVLEKKGNKALLISKKVLDIQPYNKDFKDITWEKCTLRKWLNKDFMKAAFSSKESKKIQNSKIENKDNKTEDWHTKGGKDTIDKIFLLSIDEANKYYKTEEKRKAEITDYGIKKIAKISGNTEKNIKENWLGEGKNMWYWLRSPGDDQHYAACVDDGGTVSVSGVDVDSDSDGVRPALWVNL